MSTQPRPKSKVRKLLMQLAIRVLILLLIYVLSIGPMYWQWEEAMMTGENDTLLVFYLPLMLAAEYCPPFRHMINNYIERWAYS